MTDYNKLVLFVDGIWKDESKGIMIMKDFDNTYSYYVRNPNNGNHIVVCFPSKRAAYNAALKIAGSV